MHRLLSAGSYSSLTEHFNQSNDARTVESAHWRIRREMTAAGIIGFGRVKRVSASHEHSQGVDIGLVPQRLQRSRAD